jgi:hypothetical protein
MKEAESSRALGSPGYRMSDPAETLNALRKGSIFAFFRVGQFFFIPTAAIDCTNRVKP